MGRVAVHVRVNGRDLPINPGFRKLAASGICPLESHWCPIWTVRLPARCQAARIFLACSTVKAMVFSW